MSQPAPIKTKQDIWQEMAEACTNVTHNVHFALVLSSLLAAFFVCLWIPDELWVENLPVAVEARRAIYDFQMKTEHNKWKITDRLDLLF
jgi:hypothetical protein